MCKVKVSSRLDNEILDILKKKYNTDSFTEILNNLIENDLSDKSFECPTEVLSDTSEICPTSMSDIVINSNQADFLCKYLKYFRGTLEQWYVNKEEYVPFVQDYIVNLLKILKDDFICGLNLTDLNAPQDIFPYLKVEFTKR